MKVQDKVLFNIGGSLVHDSNILGVIGGYISPGIQRHKHQESQVTYSWNLIAGWSLVVCHNVAYLEAILLGFATSGGGLVNG